MSAFGKYISFCCVYFDWIVKIAANLESYIQKPIAGDLAIADLRFLSSPVNRSRAERYPPKTTAAELDG